MNNASKLWSEISVVNNLKFEFRMDNNTPILVANDFWKFPDRVEEFFRNGYWWDTSFFGEPSSCIRPGLSALINPEIANWFGMPIAKALASLLGLKYIHTWSMNGNCVNGNMKLPNLECTFPHTDLENTDEWQPALAYNINLTKSENVKTGFWSFNGKKSRFEFDWHDRNLEKKFHKTMEKTLSQDATWFQIEDYDPWKLEHIHTMCYNSITAYPSSLFHNLYMKDNWFIDHDRITIAGFLNTSLDDLDFPDEKLEDVSFAWEFLYLDRIHNYHPKQTKPVN